MAGGYAPNRVKELRKAKGLTLEELAARVRDIRQSRGEPSDLHLATINKIESSNQRLHLDDINDIAAALGVTPFEIIGQAPIKMAPLLGTIAGGNWLDAHEEPQGWVPLPGDTGGPQTFALRTVGDSMDKIVIEGGVIAVDPEKRELIDKKVYAVRNEHGEATFKRFSTSPLELQPVSTNPRHKPIEIGREPFTVIGQVVWAGFQP